MFNHKFSIIATIAGTIVSVMILQGCSDKPNSTKQVSAVSNSVMKSGQNAVTSDRAMVGTTMDYFNQMEKLSSQGYADQLQLMANSQAIYILPAGVHVQVLDVNAGTVHIKLLDDPWKGHEGYTEMDMLHTSP